MAFIHHKIALCLNNISIMMSKRKPFVNKDVDAAQGNDVQTAECSLPPARGGGMIIEGETTEDKVTKLMEKLKTEAKVL